MSETSDSAHLESDIELAGRRDRVWESSLRELVIVLVAWAVFAVWVIGYCAVHAYDVESDELILVFGIPSWVFWGVAVPWAAATTFTIFFATFLVRDHDSDEMDGRGALDPRAEDISPGGREASDG